jgi:hypothetical protein
MDIIKNDKDFKEAIGAFIIAFSELEFGLVDLCSMTDFDLRQKDKYFIKYLGYPFEQKIRHLSEFISDYLPELKAIWNNIKIEIGVLNRERRFLAHGFSQYYLPNETITASIKEKGKITTEEKTIRDIKDFTNRIHQVNTGENGINGEFHTLFTKNRINKWNDIVNDDSKIIYKVNDKIISNWKGEI